MTHRNTIVFCIFLCAAVVCAAPQSAAQVWVSQGPAGATNGQVEGVPGGIVTGAIEAVVVHPTNPATMWIGAVNGGVWRTDNATAVTPLWRPLTDTLGVLGSSALELDPTDASHNTLVAGTGRASSYSVNNTPIGLLRTADGGNSWVNLTHNIAGRWVSGVAPRGATIVVALRAAEEPLSDLGIFHSENAGATFIQISGSVGSGLPAGEAYDLVGDPTSASRLYAAISDQGGGNAGIFRSDDTGKTWIKISNASQDAAMLSVSNVELVVGNQGPTAPNVFSAICSDAGTLSHVHRTGDGAVTTPTWVSLDLPATVDDGVNTTNLHTGGQCGLHLSIAADPVNHNVAYVGGDIQPLPNIMGATDFSGRIFRIDAGQSPGAQATSMTHCTTPTTPTMGCGGVQRTANNSSPHGDSRAMAFDANGDLIEVDDGGIYRRTDPGGSTGDWFSLNGNLALTEQHDAAFDDVSDITLSGNQDIGATVQINPNAGTWDSFNTGDGGDVAVARNDPLPNQSARYTSSQTLGGLTYQVFDAANVFQSSTAPALMPLGGDPDIDAGFVSPLAINSVTPSRVIVAGNNGVYESADRLESISLISTEVAYGGGGRAIAYGAQGNANVLYFAAEDNVYWRTAAPGTAPAASDPDPTGDDEITSVAVNPGTPTEAFALDTNQVFWTVNAATSWTDITGNLLSLAPGRLRTLETSGDKLFVGSDFGVFSAPRSGGFATWSRLGSGLPRAPVFELDHATTGSTLVAGTLGRGSWKLVDAPACAQALTLSSQIIAGPVVQQANVSLTLGPSLTVTGTNVVMIAPAVNIVSGTRIQSGLIVSNMQNCP